jgi:hypothetical protein
MKHANVAHNTLVGTLTKGFDSLRAAAPPGYKGFFGLFRFK